MPQPSTAARDSGPRKRECLMLQYPKLLIRSTPLLVLLGCSEPQCLEGERKIGNTCVPLDLTEDAATPAPDGFALDLDASATLLDAGATKPDAASPDAATPCYLDRDGDGVGAGASIPCPAPELLDAAGSALVRATGDCDDADRRRAPTLPDLCGDQLDNDCDGKPDDEANNACGGPCSKPLAGKPGAECTNGALGACRRVGLFQCAGTELRCNAPSVAPLPEVCDGADNDCDGLPDDGQFNECGGACNLVLPHKPGEPCSNGQLGACTRTGVYVCKDATTVCNAQRMKPGTECKGASLTDRIDNDCDGATDEPPPASSGSDVFGGAFASGACIERMPTPEP